MWFQLIGLTQVILMIPRPVGSLKLTQKKYSEIPVQTIAVYFGHGKENLFLVRDIERQDIKSPFSNGACIIPIGCIRQVKKLSE